MIIFRTDLAPQTGLRPLRRCAYLAALLKKNTAVRICSREDKQTAKFLAQKGITAELLKDPGALELAGVTAVVFDLAQFSATDSALLAKAKNAGIKTIQIVSPGGVRQASDFLVQPLFGSEDQSPPGQFQISGPEYALLHHKFRHFNRAKRKYRKNIKNIFINLGDLLPYRELRAIIDTLHRLHCKMKIAPGLNLKKSDKRNLMKIYPGIHFCGRSESPARAYFEADLALVPPGDEALEAACVGTPALCLPMNKDQEALADACATLGIGVKVPALAAWSVQAVRDAIMPLTPELREKTGAAGRKLVDGLGSHRFLKILQDYGIIN